MRDSALALLACPGCHGDLAIGEAESRGVGTPPALPVGRGSSPVGSIAAGRAIERDPDGHIMTGELACAGCAARYPIVRGVPRLAPARSMDGAVETAARFGAEWKIFDHMSSYQEQWLEAWLTPVSASDFRGKTVFEGGCGKGRHTVVAAGWGVKAIVALDLGEAIDVAFMHTRHLPNVHAVQGDLLQPPARAGTFDLGFSVGVLHHLPAPRAGFDSLRKLVRPGGKIAIWVYGLESNEWIVRWVNPVRENVTARMSPRLLYWLSLPPSAALSVAAKLYATRALGDLLPYRGYIRTLAPLPLREVHSIVFDQLVTPIAYYLPEAEVRSWFAVAGLSDVTISWHNKNSWTGTGTVTA